MILEKRKLNTKEMTRSEIKKLIESKVKQLRSYTPRVGVFGVTGVGKSSLCNALFGRDLAQVSDVSACTRDVQEIQLGDTSNGSGIILLDVPGVGETIERDKEYFQLYKDLSPTLDLVIWVIKADDRAYAIAEKAYKEILSSNLEQCPVLFVINQVDKIEPLLDWDRENNKPMESKEFNIQKKVIEISNAFGVPTTYVQTASVAQNYNVIETMEKIIEILPNEKKFSMYREATEAIKTEKMAESAEMGIWESVKEFAGDAWDTVKDVAKEVAVEGIKTVAKIAISFITKFKFW
ncbi:GTPase family protein [Pectobacterium parvum]|uniref:GTPase family protein n=1 Tax=Pectobacterium parvum TaxID=2778550 RepID=A0ABW8FUM6_9GAMM